MKKIRLHWCLLDRDCREHGVPPMLYITMGTHTVRFNPPYDRQMKLFGRNPWSWPSVQHWTRQE